MVYNEDKNAILGSGQRFDLRVVPFSRRGSYMCVLEDPHDRNLYLSITRSPEARMQRKNLIKIVPIKDNKEVPYSYQVLPEKLTIYTFFGTIEMCFDDKGCLRIRLKNINLRLASDMMLFEHCTPSEDGSIEAGYVMMGKLLFVPIRGAMYTDAMWVPNKSRADDFMIEFLPSVETGIAEAVIHEYYSNGLREEGYEDFDYVAKGCCKEFSIFMKMFAKVPKTYEKFACLAAWIIWTHTLGPGRQLKSEAVYMSRTSWLRAFCQQQAFQAMAVQNKPLEAAAILTSVLDYQDEMGWLPESVSDNGISHLPAASAVMGCALLYLMKVYDFSQLPFNIKSRLYEGMTKIADWWMTYRDRNGSGIPQYYRAEESGWDNTSFVKSDFPLQSGDLLAMLVLLTEACAKLAATLGTLESEYEKWKGSSKKLLSVLLSEFWDGELFIARRAADGEPVKDQSLLGLLPIILGERLPKEVSRVLLTQLMDEETLLSPRDILSEGPGSLDHYDSRESLADGYLMGGMEVLLAIGLKEAGYSEACKRIAQRWCDICLRQGLVYKHPLSMAEQSKPNPQLASWDSWAAACFLILGSFLS